MCPPQDLPFLNPACSLPTKVLHFTIIQSMSVTKLLVFNVVNGTTRNCTKHVNEGLFYALTLSSRTFENIII